METCKLEGSRLEMQVWEASIRGLQRLGVGNSTRGSM